MEEQVRRLKAALDNPPSDLASGEETTTLKGHTTTYGARYDWEKQVSWNQVLAAVGPDMYNAHVGQLGISSALSKKLHGVAGFLEDSSLDQVKMQLVALGLVKVQTLPTVGKGAAVFWTLTERGRRAVISLTPERHSVIAASNNQETE